MSDETKMALEHALHAHLRDEELLDPDDLLTEFIIVAAALPAERTDQENSYLLVSTSEGLCRHHGEGLAWSYLHLNEADRLR